MSQLNVEIVRQAIERALASVDSMIGPKYKVTFVARYDGTDLDDADIVIGNDDLAKVSRAVNRLNERDVAK
ncbi:MAG TPA: hypothetical protein VF534_04385 [Paraburkholderia sp.]